MMRGRVLFLLWGCVIFGSAGLARAETVVFEGTSPYHHILVVDRGTIRTLHFDNSTQSQMSLRNPLYGHFEYTEYFHMPWLWNDQIEDVLMIGLGGGSIQRAYQAYYPEVSSETVELDPKVVDVAKRYFHLMETRKLKILIGDGRMHLRRAQKKYDLILLDAYTANRYGSYIPYALTTKEFFELADKRLSENGVLAYNVMGTLRDRRESIVGSIYNTLKASFPQVYMFPAINSYNVVFVATKSDEKLPLAELEKRADALQESKATGFPRFRLRLKRFRSAPPLSAARSRILTDDFAPVDGMLKAE